MNRGHRAPSSIVGSLRVLEKGYLLEQGSTSILEHLGNSIALEYARVCSSILAARAARAERARLSLCASRASMLVPLLEHAEHRSMLCSNMLVHNTKRVREAGLGKTRFLRCNEMITPTVECRYRRTVQKTAGGFYLASSSSQQALRYKGREMVLRTCIFSMVATHHSGSAGSASG